MIKVKFKRGLDHNYLVVEEKMQDTYRKNKSIGLSEEVSDFYYTIEMLSRNKIKGFIDFSYEKDSEGYVFYYEISSLWPLTLLYEKIEIDSKILKNLIEGMIKAIDNLSEYFLNDEKIVMLPEYLYVDPDNYEVKIMYYPLYDGNMRADFVKLAEFILDKVNHEDEKAVMLAYSLYKTVRNDNFTVSSLRRIIKNDCDDNKKEISKSSDNLIRSRDYSENKIVEQDKSNENSKYGDMLGTKRRRNFVSKIKETHFVNGIFKMIIPVKEDEDYDGPYIASESDCEETYNCIFDDKSVAHDKALDDITEAEKYGQTVLLSEENSINSEYYLKNTENDKIYEIKSFPATIGKMKECVDIALTDLSVSRIHASLSKKEDKIFIKDLGSKNGTYINNVMIDNEEEIYLEEDDEIKIGRLILEFKKNS